MENKFKVMRLALNTEKAVQAIDFVAQRWNGLTQYYVCKVMYFADKAHCLDWGRTITGDRYVAMDHGPVPSRVYEMLKPASGEEDELLNLLHERLLLELDGNKIHVCSRNIDDFPALSDSDKEYLQNAINFCRPKSFAQLRATAHQELAWKRAAEKLPVSNNPPMDLADWFDDERADREKSVSELIENHTYGVR
jgi:uncharacterized phage-associated protein